MIFLSSEPGFWEINKKMVAIRPCAHCRNLGGTEPRAGRVCKTIKAAVEYREETNLSEMRKQQVETLSSIVGDSHDYEGLAFNGIKEGKV